MTIAGFALDGIKWDASISTVARARTLRWQGRPRLQQGLGGGVAEEADAADQEDATLRQEDRRKGIWVEPELLAEIEYRAKSAEGKVRHPFFNGLREDL
jgi:bifunctional non-homologous end joining protein LigD